MTPLATPPPAAAKAVRIIHAVLSGGVVAVTLLFVGVRYLTNIPPIIPAPIVGYVLTAVSVAVMTVATVVLRPGVPVRSREQSIDAFWGDMTTRGATLATWALCEGSGVIGAVSYLVTGVAISLGGTALAVVALVWLRPATLEQLEL